LLLARRHLEGKLKTAVQLKAARFGEFILARPIASAGMIAAALGVTPRAAQDMVAELGFARSQGAAAIAPGTLVIGDPCDLFAAADGVERACSRARPARTPNLITPSGRDAA